MLAGPNRFGTKAELVAQPDAVTFVESLYARGFAAPTLLNPGRFALPGPLKATLLKYLPPPDGVTPDTFFANYRYFVSQAPAQRYEPAAMADEIWERVVVPTQAASALFEEHPMLTRLYSTISPADMTRDPAFSFNLSLPAVSNEHRANMQVSCGWDGTERGAVLTTEQGWAIAYPDGRFGAAGGLADRPASLRIEVLREEGPAQILTNNALQPAMPAAMKGGCASVPGLTWLGFGALAALWKRRR